MAERSDGSQAVTVLYRNHRGQERERTIEPVKLFFGSNRWHPEPQWLLHCKDVERGGTEVIFAMGEILRWGPEL